MQTYPFTKGALYQLYAAVNQVSDIALEPGETLVSVSAGDTVRWVVGDTQSGSGDTAQVHILVKPIATDLQTNLVIATDRRTYHLELQSIEETYMASVSWSYPQSDLMAINKRNAALQKQANLIIDNGLNLEQLKFRYQIEGDAPWAPLRAFDDGKKVYLQFPSGLSQLLYCRSIVCSGRTQIGHRATANCSHYPDRRNRTGGPKGRHRLGAEL